MKKGYFFWIFIIYAIGSAVVTKDYGVPVDEFTQRIIGIENNYFILHGEKNRIEQHGYFGPLFESFAYLIEQCFYDEPMSFKLMIRHWLLLAIFLWSMWVLFKLLQSLFKHYHAAAMATLLFGLLPRLFADSHYNSKDTLFLSMSIFAFWAYMKGWRLNRWGYLLFAGFIAGLAASIRLNGLFLIGVMGLAWLIKWRHNYWHGFVTSLALLGGFVIGLYCFYPFLWIDPLHHPFELLKYVSKNPWPWPTLVAGRMSDPAHMWRGYLPVWMGVTLPILFIIAFIIGTYFGLKILIKNKGGHWLLPFALLFWVPFLYAIISRAVIYDSWRHLQFLHLPLTVFVGFALDEGMSCKPGKQVFYGSFLWVLYQLGWLIYVHPFSYVYFNEFKQWKYSSNQFELDYWGVSGRILLEDLAKMHHERPLKVRSFGDYAWQNLEILPPHVKSQFMLEPDTGKAEWEIQLNRQGGFGELPGKTLKYYYTCGDTFARIVWLKPH